MTSGAPDSRARQWSASRVRDLLRAQLLADQVATMPPSEEVLAREYGVSRNTMRDALAMLVSEGLLQRRRGIGTQLLHCRPDRLYDSRHGFVSAMPQMTERIRYVNLDLDLVQSVPYLVKRFGSADQFFVYWERVTVLDGEPIAVWRSHLPATIFASLVDEPPARMETVYSTVARVARIEVGRTCRTIEARPADVATAQRLRVPTNFPMFHVARSIYGSDGTLLELGYGFTRGDRYAVTYDSELDGRASISAAPP